VINQKDIESIIERYICRDTRTEHGARFLYSSIPDAAAEIMKLVESEICETDIEAAVACTRELAAKDAQMAEICLNGEKLLKQRLADLEHQKKQRMEWMQAGGCLTEDERHKAMAFWEDWFDQQAKKIKAAFSSLPKML